MARARKFLNCVDRGVRSAAFAPFDTSQNRLMQIILHCRDIYLAQFYLRKIVFRFFEKIISKSGKTSSLPKSIGISSTKAQPMRASNRVSPTCILTARNTMETPLPPTPLISSISRASGSRSLRISPTDRGIRVRSAPEST